MRRKAARWAAFFAFRHKNVNQVKSGDLSSFAGRWTARQRTGAVADSFPMNENPLNIWQLRSHDGEAIPFRDGVDRAMAKAFPPVDGEVPERIAKALQALEAAMGGALSSRPSSQCGSGGTPRDAAHWHLMSPMAAMPSSAFLPNGIRHGLRHPSGNGIRP